MAPPWKALKADELGVSELAATIEEEYGRLEKLFDELNRSRARLRTMPELPMPTLAVPYELATVYCLRGLELARGAAQLIESNNQASAFPVIRSLFELWAAATFAHERFQAQVVRGSKWKRFDEIAGRLLLGSTSSDIGPDVIGIGDMIAVARSHFSELIERLGGDKQEVVEHIDSTYAQLSDGTHPTQRGMMGYFEEREDGLGSYWKRSAASEMLQWLIQELHFSVRILRETLLDLRTTADDVEVAARTGPMQDPKIRQATIAYIERLLEGEGISPESREKMEALHEYLTSGEPISPEVTRPQENSPASEGPREAPGAD